MLSFLVTLARLPALFFCALNEIAARRRLLLLALAPAVFGLISFLIFMALAWHYRLPLASWLLPGRSWWLLQIAQLLVVFCSVVVSFLAAWLAALTLGGWALEAFLETLIEERLEYKIPDRSIWQEALIICRAIPDNLLRLTVLAALAMLTVILAAFPILMIAPFLLGSFLLAFNFIDLPLQLMAVSFRERWALASRHRPELLAAGIAFAGLAAIPFLGIFLILPAYHVAIQLLAGWKDASGGDMLPPALEGRQ